MEIEENKYYMIENSTKHFLHREKRDNGRYWYSPEESQIGAHVFNEEHGMRFLKELNDNYQLVNMREFINKFKIKTKK